MTESRKDEEEKSMVSISLGSEFLSVYTTQEDLLSRSDSFVTKSSFINTSFPDSSSSCNNLQCYYVSDDDEDITDHVDIRIDIHQLWKQKKELEKALFEAKQREACTRPHLMRKKQLDQHSNLLLKRRKWDEDTCDRFQLRPIRLKSNDSILNKIATCRDEIRVDQEGTAKRSNDVTVTGAPKKAPEKRNKSVRSQQHPVKPNKESRHSDPNGRKLPARAQRPAVIAHEDVPRSANLVISAMMWISRSSWWGSAQNVSATQIRIPPPNRRI